MVFRHLPITSIHPLATKAAEAAECAGRQGKFWEMHDSLFLRQKEISAPTLLARANELGLNAETFSACFDGEAAALVEADIQSARSMGITGTPTFLVGRVMPNGRVQLGERLQGAKSADEFKAVIDKYLNATK